VEPPRFGVAFFVAGGSVSTFLKMPGCCGDSQLHKGNGSLCSVGKAIRQQYVPHGLQVAQLVLILQRLSRKVVPSRPCYFGNYFFIGIGVFR
jgi:hypothetical protein